MANRRRAPQQQRGHQENLRQMTEELYMAVDLPDAFRADLAGLFSRVRAAQWIAAERAFGQLKQDLAADMLPEAAVERVHAVLDPLVTRRRRPGEPVPSAELVAEIPDKWPLGWDPKKLVLWIDSRTGKPYYNLSEMNRRVADDFFTELTKATGLPSDKEEDIIKAIFNAPRAGVPPFKRGVQATLFAHVNLYMGWLVDEEIIPLKFRGIKLIHLTRKKGVTKSDLLHALLPREVVEEKEAPKVDIMEEFQRFRRENIFLEILAEFLVPVLWKAVRFLTGSVRRLLWALVLTVVFSVLTPFVFDLLRELGVPDLALGFLFLLSVPKTVLAFFTALAVLGVAFGLGRLFWNFSGPIRRAVKKFVDNQRMRYHASIYVHWLALTWGEEAVEREAARDPRIKPEKVSKQARMEIGRAMMKDYMGATFWWLRLYAGRHYHGEFTGVYGAVGVYVAGGWFAVWQRYLPQGLTKEQEEVIARKLEPVAGILALVRAGHLFDYLGVQLAFGSAVLARNQPEARRLNRLAEVMIQNTLSRNEASVFIEYERIVGQKLTSWPT